MPKINIISYNVRGLNAPTKSANILRELNPLRTGVVFLQETHFFVGTQLRIISKDFPLWYYRDSPINRAKGVAIGFARETRFILEERKADPEGRYLYIRGKLNGAEVSLANVYGPNKKSIKYLMGAMAQFMEFKKGGAIMAEDFNLCLDSKIDSMLHAQGTGIAHRNILKRKIHYYQLVDVWRTQHIKQ